MKSLRKWLRTEERISLKIEFWESGKRGRTGREAWKGVTSKWGGKLRECGTLTISETYLNCCEDQSCCRPECELRLEWANVPHYKGFWIDCGVESKINIIKLWTNYYGVWISKDAFGF